MKILASTRIGALLLGAGVVALACRAHVDTRGASPGVVAGPPPRAPTPPPAVVDSDNDGIPDSRDACPSEPEDLDGFQDADGCPDPDNDRDNVPDVTDKCPNEPETYNGYQDTDGCPDRGYVRCCHRPPPITQELVAFDDNSAAIRPSTAAVLDSIMDFIHEEGISEITLEGHADTYERDPPALAAARAAAVQRYLVKRGVPSSAFRPPYGLSVYQQIVGVEPAGALDRRRVDVHILGSDR